MKEKVLELKKNITRMDDDFDWLTTAKRNELKSLKSEYDQLLKDLEQQDQDWIETNYYIWYEKYLHQETVGNMRLPEG